MFPSRFITDDQEYRLGVKQANYHDWERDLRVEIKSNDKVLGVVYLLPGEDHETYCTLVGWSPISQDELAAALASRPGMLEMIQALPGLDVGVGEEALNALFKADIGTTEVQDPPVAEPEECSDPVLIADSEVRLEETVRLFGIPNERSD